MNKFTELLNVHKSFNLKIDLVSLLNHTTTISWELCEWNEVLYEACRTGNMDLFNISIENGANFLMSSEYIFKFINILI